MKERRIAMSKKILLCAAMAALMLTSCAGEEAPGHTLSVKGEGQRSEEAAPISAECRNDVLFKAEGDQNNPLITNYFCADPTAVEYNGRLYVYGTNDDQQYREKGDSDNSYERIKSFVMLSTDDMVNWRFEGTIDTASVAPWIYASWAPSVVSREESDGKTHFYLYFSNSGAGVGVLTAESPTGPWSDPLGRPLIAPDTEGLGDCPNPFDPGVCIDDEGVGWLTFGGGKAAEGSDYMPGVARIVRLGSDMISLDSEITPVNTPYFFEASELNYFNGTYVYTYNTSWEKRLEWDSTSIVPAPPACSMAFMRTKTPLDTDSWEYVNYYLRNPGELGMEYSNNHSHLQKFGDRYYLFYHTMLLQKARGIDHGFRSICVSEAEVDEENAYISNCEANRFGAAQIKPADPYAVRQAEEVWLTDCEFNEADGLITARCESGKVAAVRGVDFGKKSSSFLAKVKGRGTIEVRLDSAEGEKLTAVTFDCDDWTAMYSDAEAEGKHDIFFVFDGDFEFDEWQFT